MDQDQIAQFLSVSAGHFEPDETDGGESTQPQENNGNDQDLTKDGEQSCRQS